MRSVQSWQWHSSCNMQLHYVGVCWGCFGWRNFYKRSCSPYGMGLKWHWKTPLLFGFQRKTTTLNIALSICNNPHPNTQLHVQQRLRKCKFVFYGEEATDNFAAHTGSRRYCCFVTVVATLQQRNRNKTSRCDFWGRLHWCTITSCARPDLC